MAEDKNEAAGFKVVDRRSFTSEGSLREDAGPEVRKADPAPPTTKAEPPAAAHRSPQSRVIDPNEEEFTPEPTGFDMLVSYLSTTTMFQLGLMAGPGGERIPPDMTNARRTIDLLEILQEKTKGNLTANESRLLDDVLYELRMTFMELQKRQARKG